jgi:hypothetical protein
VPASPRYREASKYVLGGILLAGASWFLAYHGLARTGFYQHGFYDRNYLSLLGFSARSGAVLLCAWGGAIVASVEFPNKLVPRVSLIVTGLWITLAPLLVLRQTAWYAMLTLASAFVASVGTCVISNNYFRMPRAASALAGYLTGCTVACYTPTDIVSSGAPTTAAWSHSHIAFCTFLTALLVVALAGIQPRVIHIVTAWIGGRRGLTTAASAVLSGAVSLLTACILVLGARSPHALNLLSGIPKVLGFALVAGAGGGCLGLLISAVVAPEGLPWFYWQAVVVCVTVVLAIGGHAWPIILLTQRLHLEARLQWLSSHQWLLIMPTVALASACARLALRAALLPTLWYTGCAAWVLGCVRLNTSPTGFAEIHSASAGTVADITGAVTLLAAALVLVGAPYLVARIIIRARSRGEGQA